MNDKTHEEERILCPLLSIGRKTFVQCMKEECAWWHTSYYLSCTRTDCAIAKIATQLAEIDTSLQ